jgi:hypothetical protein
LAFSLRSAQFSPTCESRSTGGTTGASYRELQNQFGEAEATIHRAVQRALKAIVGLLEHSVRWPSHQERTRQSGMFQRHCLLPDIVAAVDGTHIPCTPESTFKRQYHNYKGWDSVNVLVIVDFVMRIVDAVIGFPGSQNDSGILRACQVYERMRMLAENPSVCHYYFGLC